MTLPSPDCQICGEGTLDEIVAFRKLSRVTSDCKPWPDGGQLFICTACSMVQKDADPSWRNEISRIYEDYVLYPQGEGAEQAVFDSTGQATKSRSAGIVARLAEVTTLPESGSLLDIGCGNGAFLAAFGTHNDRWELHGHELDERNLSALTAIPGFQKLHTVDLLQIGQKFDLISLIHVLEHIQHPDRFIEQIQQTLTTPETIIVIEVPDWQTNPFDLLIADHLLHFTIPTLEILSSRVNLSPISLVNDWIQKEISLVARQSTGNAPTQIEDTTDPHRIREELEDRLKWLFQMILQVNALFNKTSTYTGIFGTSIAAAWLFGATNEKIDFFVDEDPNRIGSQLFGCPILAPSDVPSNANVFVPLPTETANQIAHRLGGVGAPRYTTPESYPDGA